MQFMVIFRRRSEQFADETFQQLAEAEAEGARRLYSEGVIRQIWHRGDVGGACLLVEAADEAQAKTALDALPMVSSGMLEVTVIPLRPYRGFAPRNG